MAVYLTLSPGQALVEQGFQRHLYRVIPILNVALHLAD
jgi:hypothetical protein